MDQDNCELWHLGVRTALRETGDKRMRTGTWDELVARLELFTTPNGTYAVTSPTRRVVYTKTDNHGDPAHPGMLMANEELSNGEK